MQKLGEHLDTAPVATAALSLFPVRALALRPLQGNALDDPCTLSGGWLAHALSLQRGRLPKRLERLVAALREASKRQSNMAALDWILGRGTRQTRQRLRARGAAG